MGSTGHLLSEQVGDSGKRLLGSGTHQGQSQHRLLRSTLPPASQKHSCTQQGPSPGNMLRQSHLQRYLPRERWASSAGKTASQQREDKVVALEIIISTAIQVNPLAAETRQATIIPQGAGRTAVSLKTDAAFQTAPMQCSANNTHKHRQSLMHSLIYVSKLETLHWFGT